MLRDAEGTARPYFPNKVIHRVIHRLCRGVGVIHRLAESDAGVLNYTVGTYILPQKKFTLK